MRKLYRSDEWIPPPRPAGPTISDGAGTISFYSLFSVTGTRRINIHHSGWGLISALPPLYGRWSIAAAFPFRGSLLLRNLLAIACRSSGGDVPAVSTAHDSRVGGLSRPAINGRWLIAASRSWYLLRRFLSRLTLRLLSTDRETEMPLLYATGFHYAADERSIHPINSLLR